MEHDHLIANGMWSDDEAKASSTWHELRAVRMVLEYFQEKLMNERVCWFTDNQNVVKIVQYGSKMPDLQAEALSIFSICLRQHIRIAPEWIPREQNAIVDYISRLVDYDDWMLNPGIFSMLDAMWGPHTVDRFANNFNHQVPCFNSRFGDPGAEAVDTFTCDWGNKNNWWCPPLYLVSRVLWQPQNTKAQGTLIVPQWFSSPFWPLLFLNGVEPAQFVKQFIELPRCETTLLPGRLGCKLFEGVPNTTVLALRIQFE